MRRARAHTHRQAGRQAEPPKASGRCAGRRGLCPLRRSTLDSEDSDSDISWIRHISRARTQHCTRARYVELEREREREREREALRLREIEGLCDRVCVNPSSKQFPFYDD